MTSTPFERFSALLDAMAELDENSPEFLDVACQASEMIRAYPADHNIQAEARFMGLR